MPRGPKRGSRRKLGADITVDDILLRALEGGPVTLNDILKRFGARVRTRLEKLRVRGVVVRENRGRPRREFTYQLLRPELAAKALSEKGGGLSPAHHQNGSSA
jgi:predicted ArsR family transcriptional regulator